MTASASADGLICFPSSCPVDRSSHRPSHRLPMHDDVFVKRMPLMVGYPDSRLSDGELLPNCPFEHSNV